MSIGSNLFVSGYTCKSAYVGWQRLSLSFFVFVFLSPVDPSVTPLEYRSHTTRIIYLSTYSLSLALSLSPSLPLPTHACLFSYHRIERIIFIVLGND